MAAVTNLEFTFAVSSPVIAHSNSLIRSGDDHDATAGAIYCDSFQCSDGYALIDNADREECRWGKCSDSQCCNKVCSSFDCPRRFSPVEYSDTVVCKDFGCTKRLCCEKGDTYVEWILHR